jgi:hypothetical protein
VEQKPLIAVYGLLPGQVEHLSRRLHRSVRIRGFDKNLSCPDVPSSARLVICSKFMNHSTMNVVAERAGDDRYVFCNGGLSAIESAIKKLLPEAFQTTEPVEALETEEDEEPTMKLVIQEMLESKNENGVAQAAGEIEITAKNSESTLTVKVDDPNGNSVVLTDVTQESLRCFRDELSAILDAAQSGTFKWKKG